jgi:glycerophosphoryl diester phosphodiesterase
MRLRVAVALVLAASTCGAFDLQGHRGARGLAPENTLAAFRRALDIGVTTIETDVGITRDDVVVIAHDRRLNPALTRGPDGRWLQGPGATIRSLAFSELSRYDVGRLDPSSSYAKGWTAQQPRDGERMPALHELFALVRESGKPVRFNIETKLSPLAPDETVDPATFARLVVGAIRDAGMLERTTLQSFDWRTLVEARRLAPELRTACLTNEGGNGDTVEPDAGGASPWHAGLSPAAHAGSLLRTVKAAGCNVWSPSWRNLTPERLAEAKALGLAVIPWTVNDVAEMERLVDAGVDGLITDYPDRLRGVLRARAKPLP